MADLPWRFLRLRQQRHDDGHRNTRRLRRAGRRGLGVGRRGVEGWEEGSVLNNDLP